MTPSRGARLLRAGLALLALWGFCYAALALWMPDPYLQAWQLVAGQLIAGQAFAASLGPHLGLAGWFVVAQGVVQSVVVLMLVFPLLLIAQERSRQLGFLARPTARILALSERLGARFGRWGVAALLAFLVFPLWTTGSGSIAIAGLLLGLRARTLLLTVAIGTAVSLTLWVVAFDTLETILAASGVERLPLPVPLMVLLIVAVVAVGRKLVERAISRSRPRSP
jgi:uncharacterized membrane protein